MMRLEPSDLAANLCESCLMERHSRIVRFSDGGEFKVCASCAEVAHGLCLAVFGQ